VEFFCSENRRAGGDQFSSHNGDHSALSQVKNLNRPRHLFSDLGAKSGDMNGINYQYIRIPVPVSSPSVESGELNTLVLPYFF
jgi:hypothetical protein